MPRPCSRGVTGRNPPMPHRQGGNSSVVPRVSQRYICGWRCPMRLLSDRERAELLPAELAAFDSPIPTQIVSSDEFAPTPQTARQREVEMRLKTLADELAYRQGISRRQFLRTAAGMAA